MISEKFKNRLSLILPPIRIVSIISLILLFFGFKLSWESSTLVFYGFFPLFVASFAVEWILIFKGKEFLKEFFLLYNKYVGLVIFEFTGVYVFAIFSFFPDTDAVRWSEIRFAAICLGGSVIIESIHRYVFTRWKPREWKGVKEILAIIFIVVLLVFVGIFGIIVLEQQSH